MNVACESQALNERGENGHFAYIDLLSGVPNTEYQNIDVEAGFCLKSGYDTEGSLSSEGPGYYETGGITGAGGADSTGGGRIPCCPVENLARPNASDSTKCRS